MAVGTAIFGGVAAENLVKGLAELGGGRKAHHFGHFIDVQAGVFEEKLARALDAQVLQVLIGRLFEGGLEQRGKISAGNAQLAAERRNVIGLCRFACM